MPHAYNTFSSPEGSTLNHRSDRTLIPRSRIFLIIFAVALLFVTRPWTPGHNPHDELFNLAAEDVQDEPLGAVSPGISDEAFSDGLSKCRDILHQNYLLQAEQRT